MTKLIILDRDGVINQDSPHYIKSPDEWIPIPGSIEAIKNLHQAGFNISVATNQSGIARGYYTLETLNCIHQKMMELVISQGGQIDAIYYCPHGPDDNCFCRKPKPGLLEKILERFQINPPFSNVIAIGDSLRDIETAKAIGVTPWLVLTGNGEATLKKASPIIQDVPYFRDLKTAVETLLNS